MENKNSGDYHQMLTFSLLLLGAILVSKYYPVVADWLRPTEHRIFVGVLVGLVVSFLLYRVIDVIDRRISAARLERNILGPENDAVFCGHAVNGKPVYVKPRQRAMHTQVIGTTNAGKTESVILPWAIQDIAHGRGLIIIDGKADRSVLDKLYGYVARFGREKDFRLFSLSNVELSHQFNPLVGASPEEVAERVFNAFEFDNPYYKSVQFEIFAQFLRIFHVAGLIPTFERLHQAITDPDRIAPDIAGKHRDLELWLQRFVESNASEREKKTSGLTAAIAHFAFGDSAVLFNSESPAIDLNEALAKNQIIYFQLPVLFSPFLGRATGKLALQALQSAVANRHKAPRGEDPSFFSVFLDDFTEYLYPGFVSVLNKSRSARIGVVFAHQALGDLKTLGDAISNSILTNSNLKVFMRGSDPDSSEYFARVIGTRESMKFTERARKGLAGREFTGDSSAREVEEFVFHPNKFKSSLGIGEAVLVVPHDKGTKTVHLKFQKIPDIAKVEIARVFKMSSPGLRHAPPVVGQVDGGRYDPKTKT